MRRVTLKSINSPSKRSLTTKNNRNSIATSRTLLNFSTFSTFQLKGASDKLDVEQMTKDDLYSHGMAAIKIMPELRTEIQTKIINKIVSEIELFKEAKAKNKMFNKLTFE